MVALADLLGPEAALLKWALGLAALAAGVEGLILLGSPTVGGRLALDLVGVLLATGALVPLVKALRLRRRRLAA